MCVQGKRTFANGNVYDGEWADDKKHGKVHRYPVTSVAGDFISNVSGEMLPNAKNSTPKLAHSR